MTPEHLCTFLLDYASPPSSCSVSCLQCYLVDGSVCSGIRPINLDTPCSPTHQLGKTMSSNKSLWLPFDRGTLYADNEYAYFHCVI